MPAVTIPNLPRGSIKTAVCGDHETVRHALESFGVEVITVTDSRALPVPVHDHADMLCCHVGENVVVTCDLILADQLREIGFDARVSSEPGKKYPYDCIYNCLVLKNCAVARADSVDETLKGALEQSGKIILNVRQGYARCSVAVVDERSFITADRGIAEVLCKRGFDVLLISPGNIVLEGYDTGFIGGCCGKVSEGMMLFNGDIMTHPDGAAIARFLERKGVEYQCCCSGKLVDFGGFVPLCEYIYKVVVHTDKLS